MANISSLSMYPPRLTTCIHESRFDVNQSWETLSIVITNLLIQTLQIIFLKYFKNNTQGEEKGDKVQNPQPTSKIVVPPLGNMK